MNPPARSNAAFLPSVFHCSQLMTLAPVSHVLIVAEMLGCLLACHVPMETSQLPSCIAQVAMINVLKSATLVFKTMEVVNLPQNDIAEHILMARESPKTECP